MKEEKDDFLEILKISNTLFMKRDQKYILFSIKEAFATQFITIGIARELNKLENEISLCCIFGLFSCYLIWDAHIWVASCKSLEAVIY